METVSVAGSFSPQSFSDFEIARDSRLSHSFSGLIDDVRMYDRTLSASEITQRYQMGAPVGSSTALPQGCPDIGDVCDDGTIYVRLSPDGNTPMFAVQESITGIRWAAAYGGSPIGNTQCGGTSYPGADIGCNTGMENTQYLVSEGIGPDPAPFSAARYCHSLLSNYTDDWYLPAHNELYVVYDNLLSNFGFSSLSQEFNFPISGGQSIHWSSSDRYDSDANIVDFDDGRFQYGAGETNSNHSIRCVRKGPAPRCANPYGLEGEMVYNSDHDVVQFCDGARWIAIGKAAPPTPPG